MSLYCQAHTGLCRCLQDAGHEGEHICTSCVRTWQTGDLVEFVAPVGAQPLVGVVTASPARALTPSAGVTAAPTPTNNTEVGP
jgi:hypothetical protein